MYKPAKKVKKIKDDSNEIEICFSEKSDKNEENGKEFKDEELDTNLNNVLKEFERNSSKTKLNTMTIVRKNNKFS